MLRKYLYFCLMLGLVSVFSHFPPNEVQAACIGKIPVAFTGDTRNTCRVKEAQKEETQLLEIERKNAQLEAQRNDINNGITGSNNVILGGLNGMFGKRKEDSGGVSSSIVLTQHQVRAELAFGVIPGAYQFNDPGLPEHFFFNGAAWEYYVSGNLSFGFLMQQWSRTGGRDFDPIYGGRQDVTGDVPLYFPGAMDKLQYTLYLPYVALNAALGGPWHGVFRFGIGRNQVKVKYKPIDQVLHPYAGQPEDTTHVDNAAIMFDIGVEKWVSGTKIGCAARWINSQTDTRDYQQYMDMGSSQLLCYAQFMLRPLGIL